MIDQATANAWVDRAITAERRVRELSEALRLRQLAGHFLDCPVEVLKDSPNGAAPVCDCGFERGQQALA